MTDRRVEDRRSRFDVFKLKQPEMTRKVVKSMINKIRIEDYSLTGENENSILHHAGELQILYELAAGFHNAHDEMGYIIHCGIYRAGSLCIMGTGMRDAGFGFKPIIALDPYYAGDAQKKKFLTKNYMLARQNIDQFNLQDYVCPIIYGDTSFFENTKLLQRSKMRLRLVFIDTNHTYEHTKKEIECFFPNLIDNAWLVFHDYHPDHPGVITAVNEFIDNQPNDKLDVFYDGGCVVMIRVHLGKLREK